MTAKEALADMRTDFEGYCSKCKKPLPIGTPRKFHRFSRQIQCLDCCAPKAGAVKSSSITTKEILDRIDALEAMLVAIMQHLGMQSTAPAKQQPEPQPMRKPEPPPKPVESRTLQLKWDYEPEPRTTRLPIDSPLFDRMQPDGVVYVTADDHEFVEQEFRRKTPLVPA